MLPRGAATEMDNRDKDYRYMACSDLNTELLKVRQPRSPLHCRKSGRRAPRFSPSRPLTAPAPLAR